MTNPCPPPPAVLHAFNATESLVQMAGGQGRTYRSGEVVLKPAQANEETDWIAEFYLSVASAGFRLPHPIHGPCGGFVYGGWQAFRYMQGRHLPGRWPEKIDLCLRFHAAIADRPRPAHFDRRDQNPWVIADKAAWGELEVDYHPRIAPVVRRLSACLMPVAAPSQLIHGDFGGNILFADDLPPAIIDFSPYWRPVAFAVGVVVADAVVWEGAGISLIDVGLDLPDFHQYLARAELRRVIELDAHHRAGSPHALDEIEAHLPLVDAIVERCR